MRDFQDCTFLEGATAICSLLSRLTVTADPQKDAPLAALAECAGALATGDLLLFEQRYHALTRELLCCPARRVSGDMFKDYIIYILTQRPHAFARMAAEGRSNEHLALAMRFELASLGTLFTLSDGALIRMAQERHRELKLKPRQMKDNISVMSTAVWAGQSVARPLPKADPPAAIPQPDPLAPPDFAWMGWRYGEAGLSDGYVADEALEEIYMRLMAGTGWRALQEDLWNFFAAYGCGDFLRYRLFRLENGELDPLPGGAAAPIIPMELYEAQQARLMDNAIRFMRGERADNLLITGAPGVGKTAHALAIPYELPELRLVLVTSEKEYAGLPGILQRLGRQPLKFMLLLDNARLSHPMLNTALLSQIYQPDNVLIYATAPATAPATATTPDATAPALFERVELPCPDMRQFSGLVTELLLLSGCRADAESVHSACVDYQVDERGRLTFAAAKRAARRYLQG